MEKFVLSVHHPYMVVCLWGAGWFILACPGAAWLQTSGMVASIQ
jgi:hypothetical protein